MHFNNFMEVFWVDHDGIFWDGGLRVARDSNFTSPLLFDFTFMCRLKDVASHVIFHLYF